MEDEALAEQISLGYQQFANDELLEDNGDLVLNGYDNGGSFIFANWDNNDPPSDATQRPNKSNRKSGLVYK